MNKQWKNIVVHRSTAFAATLMAVVGLGLQSCSDDDGNFTAVDDQNPVITLATDHLQTEPGREFTIAGEVTDADGIRSIRLVNDGMNLDKTINLLELYPDTLFHTYQLAYNYTASADWTEDMQFPVEITAEDVVGNTTVVEQLISPDGDFTAPEFTSAPSQNITVLLQNPKLTLNCSMSDNKALKYIKVSVPGLGINDSVTISGTAYDFKKVYTLPQTETSYEMTLTVGDTSDNTATSTSTINVSEMPDFEKMYLADVTDASQLTSDLFGVPMLIEHTGSYQYTAHYYNQKAGTGIRFIPQKTDFNPICFGIDPNTNNTLTSDPSQAQPIVLPEVGYYEIKFNAVTGEYSVSTYTPKSTPFPQGEHVTINGIDETYQLALAGAGLPGVGNWSTADPLLLTQDAKNKYLFYTEYKLTKGTEVEFTITPKDASGWWIEPYWRFENGNNDSKENEYNTKNGGNNMTKVTVPTDGTYRFEFDTELLRSRFYLVK